MPFKPVERRCNGDKLGDGDIEANGNGEDRSRWHGEGRELLDRLNANLDGETNGYNKGEECGKVEQR